MFCPDTNEIVFNLDDTHTMAITCKALSRSHNIIRYAADSRCCIKCVMDMISSGAGRG